jgi:outer membrane immunogenic protein
LSTGTRMMYFEPAQKFVWSFDIEPELVFRQVRQMKKKTIFLSSVCALAMGGSALAADLAAKTVYNLRTPQPQFSWSSCYVGGNLGYGRESRTWNGVETTPTTGFVSQRTSGGGFVGGGQLGCDYQSFSSNWVVGIEGMFDGSTINNTSGINAVPGATFNDKITSFETVTGRIGWAVDRSLLYAKGGAAWDQTNGTINGSALGLATETHSADNVGWVLGAGFEYAFASHWSARVEYDYMGLSNKTIGFPITTAGSVQFTSQSLQAILGGVNYRFN